MVKVVDIMRSSTFQEYICEVGVIMDALVTLTFVFPPLLLAFLFSLFFFVLLLETLGNESMLQMMCSSVSPPKT